MPGVHRYEQWTRVRPAGPTDAIYLPSVCAPTSFSTPHQLPPFPTLVRPAQAAGKNPKHSLDTHLAIARVTKYYPNAGVVCATVPLAVPLNSARGKPLPTPKSGTDFFLFIRELPKTNHY